MGAWGCESYSNDYTWDIVGDGIFETVQAKTAQGRSNIVADIVAKHGADIMNETGVCIVLLKHFCPVPIENLVIVRETLASENVQEAGWVENSWHRREECIQEEIAMIDVAVRNGGIYK